MRKSEVTSSKLNILAIQIPLSAVRNAEAEEVYVPFFIFLIFSTSGFRTTESRNRNFDVFIHKIIFFHFPLSEVWNAECRASIRFYFKYKKLCPR